MTRPFLLAAGLAALALAAGPALADALNPQPLPPKAAPTVRKIHAERGKLNALNPQPLPPVDGKARFKGKALASKGRLNALNPQPLPPAPAARLKTGAAQSQR